MITKLNQDWYCRQRRDLLVRVMWWRYSRLVAQLRSGLSFPSD